MTIQLPQWLVAAFLSVGGPVLVASLLNFLFSWKTPEGWELFCENAPVLAGFVKLCRKTGIDIPGFIRTVRTMTRAYRARGIQFIEADDVTVISPPPVEATTPPKDTPQ